MAVEPAQAVGQPELQPNGPTSNPLGAMLSSQLPLSLPPPFKSLLLDRVTRLPRGFRWNRKITGSSPLPIALAKLQLSKSKPGKTLLESVSALSGRKSRRQWSNKLTEGRLKLGFDGILEESWFLFDEASKKTLSFLTPIVIIGMMAQKFSRKHAHALARTHTHTRAYSQAHASTWSQTPAH